MNTPALNVVEAYCVAISTFNRNDMIISFENSANELMFGLIFKQTHLAALDENNDLLIKYPGQNLFTKLQICKI